VDADRVVEHLVERDDAPGNDVLRGDDHVPANDRDELLSPARAATRSRVE